jgi:ribosome biogenesis GTPase A
MEIELPKFDNKVDFWKTELKTYEEILQKKPAEFKKDLENIQTYRRLFLKKIGIAFIGPTKAGKSRFLNAMIGTDYLQSADQNCTFFGLKIQPTTAEPAVLFTDP